MPLQLVRSASSASLWDACGSRFLSQAGPRPGPGPHGAFLWLTHRGQRDALLERAAEAGHPGWLDPPIAFFSELTERFGLRRRPIGLLTGRLLAARLAAVEARRHGLDAAAGRPAPARGHLLDALFSELLPEGVAPETLRRALDALGGDAFARRRNRWVAATYDAFLDTLEARAASGGAGAFDPRAVHALLAERIEAGETPGALGGARRLHVYGVTSLRGRRRFFRALAEQPEVRVTVYLPLEDGRSEWEASLPVEEVEVLPGPARAGEEEGPDGGVRVHPAPDAAREVAWVARRVKELIVEEGAAPHRVVVTMRSGRRDARLAHRALTAAGVPATARVRSGLAEVPALKALLSLFRAQAEGWPWRPLRDVLSSPYFDVGADLRVLDHVQRTRRVEGLAAWGRALEAVRRAAAGERAGRLRREGILPERAEETAEAFGRFRAAVETLAEERPEEAWIGLTLELLRGERLDLRRRLCRAPEERWDVVRLDQRGVRRLEALLAEWRDLLEEGALGDASEPLEAGGWHDRLRRLLEANELAITTPGRAGVQVLEAHEAALAPCEHVFVIHANDGEFPRTRRAPGVFSEEERGRLAELGLPLTTRREALERERALWRAVTAAPEVTVSYRTADADGVPRLPSLTVPAHDPSAPPRAAGGAAPGPGAERVPGEDDRPAEREGQLRREAAALLRARGAGDASPFPTVDPARLRHAVLTAYAEELRCGRLDHHLPAAGGPDGLPASLRPHAWNGHLRDPVVLDDLARRFGEDRVWSASQLQLYGTRPFDFFLQRVLWLERVEEAEEETSALAFGRVAHAALERFFDDWEGAPPPALDEETARRLDEVLEAVLEAFEEDASEWLGLPSLWAVTRRQVAEAVRRCVARELPYLARRGEVPWRTELAFGGSEEDAEGPVRVEGTDVGGRPERLLMRGRVDRVDRLDRADGAAEAELKVVDYKSGRTPSPQGYEDGSLLQSALYMAAVERLGLGAVREAVFRSIRHGTMNGAPLKRDRLPEVLRLALSIPGRVRAGLFEAVQAPSARISDWQPGREVTRTASQLPAGSRFDPSPQPAPGEGDEPAGGRSVATEEGAGA